MRKNIKEDIIIKNKICAYFIYDYPNEQGFVHKGKMMSFVYDVFTIFTLKEYNIECEKEIEIDFKKFNFLHHI